MNDSAGLKIMRQCPRFDRCDVPLCPLDLNQDYRTNLIGEKRCTLAKSIRLRIAEISSLGRKGLTKSEWAAKERWKYLSETERQTRIAHLRKN